MSEEENQTSLVEYTEEDGPIEDPHTEDEAKAGSPAINDKNVSRSVSRSRSRSKSKHRSSKRSKKRRRSSTRSSSSRSHSRKRSRRRRSRRRTSRSRSRTRNHSRSRNHHRRSYSQTRCSRSRSGSQSARYPRSRFLGPRDAPPPSRCLGVFGLNINTTESSLAHILEAHGKLDKVQIIYDAKSGRSRGFGFAYFASVDDALEAKEHLTGTEIEGNRIRADFSLTRRPHTPTPGVYMGKPMSRRDDHYSGRSGGYGYGGGYGRSPSPHYRRQSRSRSYS